jgi:hypothetical protein
LVERAKTSHPARVLVAGDRTAIMEYGMLMVLHRGVARRMALVSGLILAGAGSAAGCKERTPCEQACVRFAVCKLEASQGQPVLGDKRPPADPDCLHECETQPEEFEKCEGTKRLCPEIRDCHGPF